MPGLELVQAPSPMMAIGISKAGVEKFLPTPMGLSSLAADGTLVIPTEKELTDNPPVSQTPALLSYFDKLREEFPQSKPQERLSRPTPTPMKLAPTQNGRRLFVPIRPICCAFTRRPPQRLDQQAVDVSAVCGDSIDLSPGSLHLQLHESA